MLYYETIEPHTLSLLKKLFHEDLFCKCRLVGGTALALQYGHRCSIDLDIFGNMSQDSIEILDILSKYGNVVIIKNTTNIHLFIVDGIRVDIVNYPYQWIDDSVYDDGIHLASDKDIAAMKVSAIENRGTKKDFIDLFYLLQRYTLSDILNFYKSKYPNHSILRALMSITYFDDAETDPMPKMKREIRWSDVKKRLTTEVSQYKGD